METPPQSHVTFEEVQSHGEPMRPLDFPAPVVDGGVRVNAFVLDVATEARNVWPVIHRDFRRKVPDPNVPFDINVPDTYRSEFIAYAPFKRLQNAIYGSVWACRVLRRHYGAAADDAARATQVQPGSPEAPIVWETTDKLVAVKMVEWAKLNEQRGRLLEDPVKEISAMQMIGSASPHVLGPIEFLQDSDCLYIVMPYCAGGDLFGVVVKYAEESNGEMGMPEPIARYWFRQILKVGWFIAFHEPRSDRTDAIGRSEGKRTRRVLVLYHAVRPRSHPSLSLSLSLSLLFGIFLSPFYTRRVWCTCNPSASATATYPWKTCWSTPTTA